MMMLFRSLVLGALLIVVAYPACAWAKSCVQPPFGGTIFVDPDIVTPSDPTTFVSATYVGQGMRTMFDRRVPGWVNVNAYLFETVFGDGLVTEIQVNPEFASPESAGIEALKYGTALGQLPTALRADMETVWIHRGVAPFGGGNNNVLIHTGQADLYVADGILEETLIHEAAHTSLDAAHADATGWLAAQSADACFISTYARDNSTREDIAESFLIYVAVRFMADRISPSLLATFEESIPNRIEYFAGLRLDMHPFTAVGVSAGVDSFGAMKARFR